jgi:uncharacterized protein (PEP-CTERM system associated)
MPGLWRSLGGAGFGVVFLGFSAAAQVEAPAAPPAPPGPAPAAAGTGFPPGFGQPFGPFAPGAQGAPLAPDSQARAGAGGFPFALVAPPPGQPTPGVIVTPSLGLTQTYNDNVFLTPRNKTDDFITNVNAGLAVAVDTARLQGGLNATVGYNFYANQTRQDGATANGAGRFLFTLLPDTLFVSASGNATTQPFGSTFSPQAPTDTTTGNLLRTYSLQVSPYAVQRFGGLATGFAGYVFQYVDQSATGRPPPGNATTIEELLQQRARSFATSFSSHQVYVGARTGEDFGRLAMQGTLSGTRFDGGGLYDGAFRDLALLETRYAFTRAIAGLVELGYERQRFNTVPRTDIDGIVWAVGVRLAPSPDSLIIVKYGRRDGFDSFRVNGNAAVGVRTTVFGSYEERLTTSALNAADLLATTTLDPLGNPVDAQTGAPVLPGLASQLLGAPGQLSKQRRASAGISQTWPRDTIALTATYLDSTPFGTAAGAQRQRFAVESTSIGLRWTHALAPVTSMTVFGSYAINRTSFGDQTPAGRSVDFNTVNAGASLVTAFSETLGAVFSYQVNWRDNARARVAPFDTGSAIQNIFTAGLRKSF